jgi:hypothetical protein
MVGMTPQRCPGWGDGPDDWLEECHDCQRRMEPAGYGECTTPDARFALQNRDGTLPPATVGLWCDSYIPPDRPEDQRLRELAKLQGIQG